jgi:hypothetical protein
LSRPLTIFSMLLRSLEGGGGGEEDAAADALGDEDVVRLLFNDLGVAGGLVGGGCGDTILGVMGVGVAILADDSVDVGLGEWRGLCCREPGVTVSKAEPRGEAPSRLVLGVVGAPPPPLIAAP